jgi:hypothetical protein
MGANGTVQAVLAWITCRLAPLRRGFFVLQQATAAPPPASRPGCATNSAARRWGGGLAVLRRDRQVLLRQHDQLAPPVARGFCLGAFSPSVERALFWGAPLGGRLSAFAFPRSSLACNFSRSAAAAALVGKYGHSGRTIQRSRPCTSATARRKAFPSSASRRDRRETF